MRGEAPDHLIERLAAGMELPDRLRVGDRSVDLLAVANDAGVVEQPRCIPVAVGGNLLDVEVVEGPAEVLSLAQDREPGEARLEGLEGEALEELVLAV